MGLAQESLSALPLLAFAKKSRLVMLRITTIHENQHATLKLEGKLLEPWLDELRSASARAKEVSGRVGLDLANLTYADAAGSQFLRSLFHQNVSVSARSPFVAELLREQQTQT